MNTLANRIVMDAFVIFLGIIVIWLIVVRFKSRRKKLIDLSKQQQTIDDKIKKAIRQPEPTQKRSTADKDQ